MVIYYYIGDWSNGMIGVSKTFGGSSILSSPAKKKEALECSSKAFYFSLRKRRGGISMNPMMLMQMKGMLDEFKKNHPKVPMFFTAAAQNVGEGSVIEMAITSPDGKKICTNMRVTADDLKLVEQLKSMGPGMM